MGEKMKSTRALGFWVIFVLSTTTGGGVRAEGRGHQLGVQLKEGSLVYREFRVRQSLNSGWRFKRQAAPGAAVEPEFAGAEQPGYDDSSWALIELPHSWDATPYNPFATAHHFRGLGWYRRSFNVPSEWQGRHVWLEFKGVFQIADVWINDRHVGRHVDGFTGFEFDITDFVKWGESNFATVRVNDVLDPEIAPGNETNVPGYGGIYRSVALEVTDSLRISPNGTWVTMERAGNGAMVHIRTWVQNHGQGPRKGRLETLVVDSLGQPVTKLETNFSVGPNEEKEFEEKTRVIPNPRLWSPDSPYLYHLVSTVLNEHDTADRNVTPFGIRFMGYDPAKGFTLNGGPINLHGVNRRQDYGFLGDAVPESVGVRDIQLIKGMGANFIRTSHYPQDPTVLDACDQLGILVWEEIPNIKIYMYPASTEEASSPVYTERFPRGLVANLKKQLGEMIERDRNHAAIIIWGLADDLDTYHYPEDFVELSNAAHALDPTRWTAGRSPHVTDVLDATSEPNLVREHQAHPERKYIWNEWGSFISERGREGLSDIRHENVFMADSDAALLIEGYLMQWNALPWLGTAKWCMFDAGEPNKAYTQPLWERPDGKVMLRWPFNDYMGVADMWRLPKEGYYLLQSQWTEKPMAHIVGHWTWPGQEGKKRQVRVYSNCDSVELLLNGRSLGVHQPATEGRVWEDFRQTLNRNKPQGGWADEFNQQPLPGATLRHPPFIWDDIPYENGNLVAVGRKAGETVRDELRTAGTPARIEVKTEKAMLAVDRGDVSFLEADVTDSNGVPVPSARPWITFSARGPGRLLGATAEIDAITGVAAINVESIGQPGEIEVVATSPGLESGFARLRVGQE
jgi:beta-galactosidase